MSGGSDSSLRWIVTYADMISLLMVLFLLLFSASQVQKEKLLAISEAMRRALHKDASTGASVGSALLSTPGQRSVTSVSEALEEAVRAMGLDRSVSISTDERGTTLAVVDSIFFKPGSADLAPASLRFLKEVGQFCKDTRADLRVEGHTDNQPIENKKTVRSNWQLSALRATNVVEFFITEIGLDPRKISATGYADSRPLVPNTTSENRARNRRIEIILLTGEIVQTKENPKSLTNLDLVQRQHDLLEEKMEKELKTTTQPGEKR